MNTVMDRARRGFTLIELVVVVAVIAIGAAVAIPSIVRAQENAERRAVVRNVSNHLRLVRMTAITQRIGTNTSNRGIPGVVTVLPIIVQIPQNLNGPSSMLQAPADYAALRVLNPLVYQLVIRRGGQEKTLGLVPVNRDIQTMRIIYPAPLHEIRFSGRGLRDPRSAEFIVIEDTATGQRQGVRVSLAGMTDIL